MRGDGEFFKVRGERMRVDQLGEKKSNTAEKCSIRMFGLLFLLPLFRIFFS